MKTINVTYAVLGGMVLGAALGVLFAPEKGTETRKKISDYLKKKGICCSSEKLDKMVNDLATEME